MAFLLSLETSTSVCSVALHEDEKLLASAEVHREQSHASKLAVLVNEVLSMADVKINQVNAVAISSGPGSYTGLRIGTSTAKGLCYALNVPLISVGTLDVLSAQMKEINMTRALLCPMIDARRMEVYCQVIDAGGNILQPVEAKIIDAESFSEYLSAKPVIFFGNGAAKCKPVIQHANAFFVENIYPTGVQLGAMAFRKFQRTEVEDLVHFEPFYLKEFMVKKPANKESIGFEQN